MNQYSEHEKLNLFKNLFKGREDVFAVRWEKGNKSGYMPAYHYDPYMYRLHKMKGGTFKDYKDKTYLPLTDQQLLKHFNGEQLIGIYPLLQGNTSWFIAADFDKEKWRRNVEHFSIFVKNKIFLRTWNAPVPAKEVMSGYFSISPIPPSGVVRF
ncbi:type III restriction enzyme, res subunit [Fulvivirga imtechensis AK7]|uniref:Type III restriction enzyme, res subunit n=1 Tax=Fulvivirga imtechensis AK7 TaxID=1237149 RepID=L8JNZ6_9BACT|nr:type III restriction enzyme, res subunit [Fulvivirga imtechensis]ELR69908.1 type III restriction enzyme, res subunit [Fulvivirga imtechensis AK7]